MQKNIWKELKRQTIHFLAIFIVLASYFISYEWMAGLLAALVFIVATHMLIRPIVTKVPGIKQISDFFYKMARKEEIKKGYFFGATTFLAGLLVVFLIFQSLQIFRVAALVLIIGDSFSTVVGRAFGEHKILFNKKKSLEGTFTGFAIVFLVLLTQVSLPLAALLAAVGMLVESLPLKINDNFTIPIIVGAVYWMILI